MKLSKTAIAVSALIISSSAWAHGYIEVPQSRAYKCKLQTNKDCGPVQYEPQSVEQKSGFPTGAMPRDGELASASISNYSPLDKQSVNMWDKDRMKSGINNFTWSIKAQHRTTNWRYYITKQNWDQNKPLTRDSFDLTPFCQIDGKNLVPPVSVTHSCNVPQRTGYQVIYGVWEIADTPNSFYQAVDVNFGDDEGVVSEWNNQLDGKITGKNLQVGDKVIARFFDDQGEVQSRRTAMPIAIQEQTDKNRWSYDLSTQINNSYDDVRAGVKDSRGNVNPTHGVNDAFVNSGSRMNRVAISYEEQTPEFTEEVTVSNLQAAKIRNGKSSVRFAVKVKGAVNFEASVFDHAGSEKGYIKQDIADSTQQLNISLNDVAPGHHMLKYFAVNKDGNLVKQEVIDFQLEDAGNGGPAEYQYVFPKNLKSYVAGTVVLQPKDGKTYQCKLPPYSGYCVQWTPNSTQYEPGVGSNWQDAWTLK